MKYINCNLCGSSEYGLLFKNFDRLTQIDNVLFNIVRCNQCGLVYINPQPTLGELGRYYPENYGPFRDDYQIFKYGSVSQFLKNLKSVLVSKDSKEVNNIKLDPFDDTSIRYLDFGCGSGAQLERVKKIHPRWDFYGLDINPVACQKTKEKGFKVFCGDVLKIDLPSNFFDIVNMSHVIEHLSDPVLVLRRINKITKPSGRLIISTPNFDSISAKIFKKFWYALDTPRHLFIFNKRTITALLNKTGFAVEKIEYDANPKVFIRSFKYIMGSNDLRISPILYHLLKPASKVVAELGNSSIMTVYASKLR